MKLIKFAAVPVIALTAGISLAACGPTVTKTPATHTPATSAPASSSAPATTAPAQATTGHVGDTFTATTSNGDKYTVTLVKVIDPATSSDNYSTPKNGFRFVGAVFTVTGVSGSLTYEDANNDASVVGSDTQTYTPDFSPIAGYTNFNSGDIDVTAGQTVTGAVTFQVPSGVQVDRVQWQANGFGQHATWTVSK